MRGAARCACPPTGTARQTRGPMTRIAAVSIAALWSVAPAAQDDVVRTGKTCVLTVHPGDHEDELASRIADEAFAAIEQLRPLLERWQVRPASPVAVHLHLAAPSFRAVEKQVQTYTFTVDEFCHQDGSEGHVLQSPLLSRAMLERLGLPPWTEATLQRIAAQLVALQLAETTRRDPWLGEVFAFGALDALRNPSGAYGVDPSFDGRRGAYARFHAEGNGSSFAGFLAVDRPLHTPDDLALRHEYATLAAQYFATTGSSWARKLLATPKSALARGPARSWIVESILGKDAAKNEYRFQKLVGALRPTWFAAWSGVGVRDGRIVLAGATDRSARAWGRCPAAAFAVRGSVTLAGSGERELRVNVDFDEHRSIVVAFVVGQGCTTYLWRDDKPGYKQLQRVELPLEVDTPFEIAIEVDTEVRVLVGGALVLTQPCEGAPPRHGWAVATNASLVFLERLRCEPLAARKK